ncbi:hypothetical protein [Aliarcobacter butzleri]|nr:hypothetical protein [Aliarcobacter butzleri]
MQKEKEFNFGVSTLPKKINQKLVNECKVIFKPINNSWFSPIVGA